MRIINCNIRGFGRIRNKKYSFGGGFNRIMGENGSGKTTLSYFIKAMLYGLSDSRKSSLLENERRRFTPWDGGAFGGSMEFSVKGKSYRVERSFGARSGEDSFALYDMDTGKLTNEYSAQLGEELLAIDADGFERTVFISEKSLSPGGENASIAAALSGISDQTGDLGEFDLAVKRLEEERKRYSKRGGGEILDTRSQISEGERRLIELKDECEKAQREKEHLSELKAQIEENAKGLRNFATERDRLLLARSGGINRANLADLQTNIYKTQEETREIEDSFGGSVPSLDMINEAQKNYREAMLASSNDKKGSDKQEGRRKPELGFYLSLILSALLILVGAALFLSLGEASIVLSAIGLTGAVLTLLIYRVKSKGNASLNVSAVEKEAERERLLGKAETLLRNLGLPSKEESFSLLRERVIRYETVKSRGRILADEYAALTRDCPHEDLTGSELDERIKRLEEKNTALLREAAVSEERLAYSSAVKEEYSALTATVDGMKRALAEKEESLRIINLTRELLTEARERLASRYLTDTDRRFADYLTLLNGTGSSDAHLNTDLDITRQEQGKTLPIDGYSKGTRELYALAARLAVTDSIYGEKMLPPIIMDDPFLSFDDKRISGAAGLVKALAEKRQIIYFTCSESRGL